MEITLELKDKMFVAHGQNAQILHNLLNGKSQSGFYWCEKKEEIGIMFEELRTIIKEQNIQAIKIQMQNL